MAKRLTVQEVANELGVCKQRVFSKIEKGHFPESSPCECGRSIMIPQSDLDREILYRGSKKRREST